MKKRILIILICGIMVLGITGCSKNEQGKNPDDLNAIQEQIGKVIGSLPLNERLNFASCYVDELNKVVVVGLVDNSQEKQDWFRKKIIDSPYIKFEQGYQIETVPIGHSIGRTPK